MPTKFTYSHVKDFVERKGFTLLSTEYTNQSTPLNILCPKHGPTKTTFKQMKMGTGCFKCGQKLKNLSRKKTLEFVRQAVEKAGYSLLSTEYITGYLPLIMLCSKHGEFKCTYDAIKIKHGCRSCGYDRAGQKTRTSFEEIKEIVSKTKYTLISTQYTRYKQKIKLSCPDHGEFYSSLQSIKTGQGCKHCGYARTAIARLLKHEDFLKRVEHFNYEFLSPIRG